MPGLGRLDVLVAGAVYAVERDRRMPVYEQHRDRGFLSARAIGMSFHDRSAALAALQDKRVDIAFIRYNPDHPGAAKDLFPHLPSPLGGKGPGVRGNKCETLKPPHPWTLSLKGRGGTPAARTLLFNFTSTFGHVPPAEMEALGLHGSKYWHPEITDHYRFVLSRPEIDGVLLAPKTPEELQGVAEALTKGPLTEEEQAYLMDVALVARGDANVAPEEQEPANERPLWR
jgi:hypothetical protein